MGELRGRSWRPGRDRHAVRHPAPDGRRKLVPSPEWPRPRVVVVGGGIAGLAASTALAERGVSVQLLEQSPRLGGRVAAWPLDDGRTMSRGFHAFFPQYYNPRAPVSPPSPGSTTPFARGCAGPAPRWPG